jgi:hypothetical protein
MYKNTAFRQKMQAFFENFLIYVIIFSIYGRKHERKAGIHKEKQRKIPAIKRYTF